MTGGNALIAQHAANLVDPLQAPHDQALEIELGGDAQVEVSIEGVVVGDEGPGERSAGDGLEHGGINLEEAALVQIAAQGADYLAAEKEDAPRLLIGYQIQVALAVAQLDVAEAMPLLRRGPQGLGEQGEGRHLDRDFAGAGAKDSAGSAQEIAAVQVG